MVERNSVANRYRKKPIVIEAVLLGADMEAPLWWSEAIHRGAVEIHNPGIVDSYALIKTLEGTMRAERGDWIIRGVKGELYPCKPDIFEATYEPASSPPHPPGDMVLVPREATDERLDRAVEAWRKVMTGLNMPFTVLTIHREAVRAAIESALRTERKE